MCAFALKQFPPDQGAGRERRIAHLDGFGAKRHQLRKLRMRCFARVVADCQAHLLEGIFRREYAGLARDTVFHAVRAVFMA